VKETFSITSDQISKLHNAYWLINNEIEQLEEVLRSDKIVALRKAVSIFSEAYIPLMEEKDKEWDRRNSYYDDLRENHKFRSVWSIYDVVSFQANSGIEGTVLKYGKVNIPMKKDTMTMCITWLDMWKYADQAIKESEDEHHLFIERFYDRGDGVIELITGS